jgi:hypothetical protein
VGVLDQVIHELDAGKATNLGRRPNLRSADVQPAQLRQVQ